MKLLHVTASISSRGGGVAAYLHQLAAHHAQTGCDITLCALDDPQVIADTKPIADCATIVTAPPTGPRALGWSRALRGPLQEAIAAADVVHLHGLRTVLNRDARKLALQHCKPIIISPHGQLYPQVLARNPLRKRILAKLFVDRTLHSANCFHATAQAEADHLRAYGLPQPIGIVPIGINAADYGPPAAQSAAALDERYPETRGRRRVLFLSLLHAKKGLDRLAQAWAGVVKQHPGWSLIIAGPDDGYEAQARRAFQDQCPADSVVWAGPVYDDDKATLLAGCDVLVLPSDWENFGIVVIEALASRTPVIATTGAPWGQLETDHCGWWVEPEVEALAQALDTAMSLTDEERQAMGGRGRALVEAEYTWDRCADQMLTLYRAANDYDV